MTVRQAAKAWGVSRNRVYHLLLEGRVPGAKILPTQSRRGFAWSIPDGTQKPAHKKLERKTGRRQYLECKALEDRLAHVTGNPLPPLNERTHAEYIWEYQGKYTIGQLAKALGISSEHVIDLYEKGFKLFPLGGD